MVGCIVVDVHVDYIRSYDRIGEVHKRRYLLRPSALELFADDGRNFLFVLNITERDSCFATLDRFVKYALIFVVLLITNVSSKEQAPLHWVYKLVEPKLIQAVLECLGSVQLHRNGKAERSPTSTI